ncbi:MAG: lysophospholipid acyltransferase family protein [Planctomycetes bacterium]|nr:lysophospholipid acyltransferase family protein [Planctomycetota bacterium]
MPLLRKRLHFWLVGVAGQCLLAGLRLMWRIKLVDSTGAETLLKKRTGKVILAFWHRNILSCLCYFRGYPIAVPVSEHRDGEFVAQVMERCGCLAVRGSSTHGALRMVRRLLVAIRDGWNCAITPDGPKGPKYSVQPGFVLLARRSGQSVYPMGVAVDRAWTFSSWDSFVFPKPGARIVIHIAEPITPEAIRARGVEEACRYLKQRLMETTRKAESELSAD